jgi:hypothetical protein
MTTDTEDEAVLNRWGGEESLCRFLDIQVAEICEAVCGPGVVVPMVQVKPSSLARGLMRERRSGADYEPGDNSVPATIGLYPIVLRDRDTVRRVLAHELIHHWEQLERPDPDLPPHPHAPDDVVSARFAEPHADRKWRLTHSQLFSSKADQVAAVLGVPLADLLFDRGES